MHIILKDSFYAVAESRFIPKASHLVRHSSGIGMIALVFCISQVVNDIVREMRDTDD